MPYLRHLGLGTWSLDALFKASRLGKGVALDALNLGLSVCNQGPKFQVHTHPPSLLVGKRHVILVHQVTPWKPNFAQTWNDKGSESRANLGQLVPNLPAPC